MLKHVRACCPLSWHDRCRVNQVSWDPVSWSLHHATAACLHPAPPHPDSAALQQYRVSLSRAAGPGSTLHLQGSHDDFSISVAVTSAVSHSLKQRDASGQKTTSSAAQASWPGQQHMPRQACTPGQTGTDQADTSARQIDESAAATVYQVVEAGCSPSRLWQLQDAARLQQYTQAVQQLLAKEEQKQLHCLGSTDQANGPQTEAGQTEALRQDRAGSGVTCIACGAGLQLILAAAACKAVTQVVCLQVSHTLLEEVVVLGWDVTSKAAAPVLGYWET